MNIEDKLVTSVINGLKALYGQDVPAAQVQLQKPRKNLRDTSRWLFFLSCACQRKDRSRQHKRLVNT